ncbi:hypothetical protein A8F94_24590 [Bacillus sp. FJAT-27225]|nr:hypothetical protein A8F94_24590 [Bacillus sp. FJAT-27225]
MEKLSTADFCERFNIGEKSFKLKKRREADLAKARKSPDVMQQKEGKENFYYICKKTSHN